MFSCVNKEKFEVEIHIVPRMSAAVLAHLLNTLATVRIGKSIEKIS